MKALIRWGIGLLSLCLGLSVAQAYEWVSPVTKCPLGYAPNICNAPRYYYYGQDGLIYGPYYYLRPSFPPHQGFLPGPIGQAIQSGFLPHELLKSKEAMTLGDMPLLGKSKRPDDGPPPGPSPPNTPQMGGYPGGGSPYGMPSPMMAGPGGMGVSPYMRMPMMTGPGAMPPSPYLQMPAMTGPGAMAPSPYLQPPMMPYPIATPPAPNLQPPYAPMPGAMAPYYPAPYAFNGMTPYGYAMRDPLTGVWQVQGVLPAPPMQGMPPQPNPIAVPMPPRPPMVMMQPPGMSSPPNFYYLNPESTFDTFTPMQRPLPPRPEYTPMNLPRMDSGPPPTAPQPNAFPTHPFVRSPRDFFMWGDMMQEERNRGNRPYPVP